MTATADFLIVGAGHAGVQLAVSLAKLRPAPSVLLVGAEPHPPYERPPLTKRMLYGEPDEDVAALRSAEYWARSPIELRTATTIVRVDAERRVAYPAGDESIRFSSLVWAAGGRAARSGLPGEELAGVHCVRTYDDLIRLRADVSTAVSAVIIGGGYVGLEVASALRRRGLAVTLVELAPRVLARVTGETVSTFFTQVHRARGVDVRVGVGVERIVADDGRASAVLLSDGTALASDVVIIGVGMRPEVGPLLEAGVRGDAAGIAIDETCHTSVPNVYAIGDCAKQVSPWSATAAAVRIESVHNAGQHASAVARAVAGLPATVPPPPRFWSTQFEHELKTVGLPSTTDDQVVRGDVDAGCFSVAYLRDGELAAIDTINRPRDFARAQALIAGHWRPASHDDLANAEWDLPRLETASVG